MSARGLLLASVYRRRTSVRNAAWVGAVVAVALVAASVAAGAGASHLCGAGQLPLASSSDEEGKGAVLNPPDRSFRLRFDDARNVNGDAVTLAEGLAGVKLAPGDDISASMSTYLRSSERTIFPGIDESGQISPSPPALSITPSGAVQVCLEMNAAALIGVRPGQYESNVGVTGKDLLIASAIPVVVTFRSSRWLALAIAAGGVLLGLLVKMLTELKAAHRAPNAPRSVRDYIRDWSFPTAVILGAITGWVGYYIIYDSNPVWGASGADWLKLFWTCFSFQLASIGGIDLARRLIGDLPGAP